MTTPNELQSERWRHLRQALDEFQSLLSGRIPNLTVESLADRALGRSYYDEQRRLKAYEGRGVYLHFSANGSLLYVGSTLDTFDRCWANDCHGRRWIDIIRFDAAFDYLALALEVFLIRRLLPQRDTQHNRSRA